MELHEQAGTIIATNDNWKDTQQSAIEATGIARGNDEESDVLKRLTPGSYTAIVRGKDNSTGVGLMRLTASMARPKLANISTRGLVQTGDDVMISGFIVARRFGNSGSDRARDWGHH